MLRKILNRFSFHLRGKLRFLFFFLLNRSNYKTYSNYTFSDEKLKFTHILESINYSKVVSLEPIYFEFGCYSGRTFSAAVNAYKFLKIKDFETYAFDSFQGLPENSESEGNIFKTGSFYMTKDNFIKEIRTNTKYNLEKKYIIEGFYDKTLTKELSITLKKPSVIHIDVDLYSSAKLVLDFITPLLQVGAVILIDDWYCFKPGENKGLQKAFKEFLEKNKNISCENWKNYSTFGKSFIINKI